ncbi:MAG: hypothetical protein ACMG6E_01045, partial [Candidatus Roizmanbacteria bacterium]
KIKSVFGLQKLESPFIPTIIFLAQFFLITGFFYGFMYLLKKRREYRGFIVAFAYGLLPTILWFSSTTILYLLLPPPRTFSFLGTGFSLVFIVGSISLLLFRCMLLYLSLRFAAKSSLTTVIYMILLFCLWFVPLTFLVYKMGIFRVPFV